MVTIPPASRVRIRSIALLVALLALILTLPLEAHGDAIGTAIKLFYTAVFCVAGYLLSSSRRWIIAYLILASPSLLIGIANSAAAPIPGLVLIDRLLVLALQIVLITVVIRFSLFKSTANDIDRIIAGICGYLILGLLWADLYTIQESITPGAFLHSDGSSISMQDGSTAYFSLVTLSTLGYGDITASSPWPRMLSALEAVAGTLYLAVFVASLISGLQRSRAGA